MAQESPAKFKGWTIPGPVPTSPRGDSPESPSAAPNGEPITLDALSGHFKIYQYKDGHRFSTDDLLVAWYATTHAPRADRVLDLGSGVGTVAQVCAWRWPAARFVTVEAQERSIELARMSIERNCLSSRFDPRLGDLRDPLVLSDSELFDVITGSPPYFPEGTGQIALHPQKAACRFELRGDLGDYLKCASRHLAPAGVFVGVFPRVQLERAWTALEAAGLIWLRGREIVLKEGEPPLLFVFMAGLAGDYPAGLAPRGSEAAYWDPPLVIRRKDGAVEPEYLRVKLSIGFPPTG